MKNFGKWTVAQRYESLAQTKTLISMGKLEKATKCRWCGQEHGILHTHNSNYDITLELQPKMIAGTATQEEIQRVKDVLMPLCWRCHMMLHNQFKHPKSYAKYLQEVQSGVQYEPVYNGGDFTQLEKHFID